MDTPSYEARVNLARQAKQRGPKLSYWDVAKIYEINKDTLRNRATGKLTQHDTLANLHKLTDLEERTII